MWDGDDVLAAVDDRGNVHVYRFDAAGDARTRPLVVGGERCVTDFDLAGGTLAFAATTRRPPGRDLHRRGRRRSVRSRRRPTRFVAGARPVPAERFTAPSTGGVEVDVWVYLPPGFDPAARYPALLNIHGGPFTQYGNRFFDEAQVQAAAGYVVVHGQPARLVGPGGGVGAAPSSARRSRPTRARAGAASTTTT